ncbi:MAG: hemolysin family protein [Bdellovibrionota bacterium]
MLSIWTLFAILPPLLLIEGLFSGAEIALLSADKLVLKKHSKHGDSGAKLALELATYPERILSTTLLITSFCVVMISGLVTLYLLQVHPKHGDLIAVLVTSPIIVILGELIPKTLFQQNANRLAPRVALPVYWAYWLFYPITRLLSSYTTRLSRMVGPLEELVSGKHRTTRDELKALLSYGKRESEIKTSEKRIIKRIFDFKDSEAKHALIPLVKVEAIDEEATVKEALERFEHHRHSRMPVYADRIDNIVGVLEAQDLFSATDLNQPIRLYITPAQYVAEAQALEDLMQEMRLEDTELVVIVDEHGGAVGILTFEDIVEEIVGEIADEFDSEALPYKELSDKRWLIQARMEIIRLNEALKLEIPEGDYETLGGFLLQQFGRIPEPKDELYFSTPSGSLKFTVSKATDRQIESVLIERLDEEK